MSGSLDEITDCVIEKLLDAEKTMTSQGKRVVAFADLKLDRRELRRTFKFRFDSTSNKDFDENFQPDKLRFVGFIGLVDPPRDAVARTVRQFRNAGIKVICMTADNFNSAKAVARSVGILTEGDHQTRVRLYIFW